MKSAISSSFTKLMVQPPKPPPIMRELKHELADSPYNKRRASCERVAKRLGIETLRDATMEMLEAVKSDIPIRASSNLSMPLPLNISLTAKAKQDSSAADELRPAPRGTLPANTASKPST